MAAPKKDFKKKRKVPSSPPEKLELRITDLSRGGSGVGRDASGRVIFIPFTAPGDRVSLEITHANKNYAQGKLLEILDPSPTRQKPRCPAFGQCGGCEWQHLPYAFQWKTKLNGVRHALARVQVEPPPSIEEVPAEKIWEYRNRVQLRGHQKSLGFYASGSHDLVSLNRCDIAHPEINRAWERVRTQGEKLPRPYKVEVESLAEGHGTRETWNARHAASGFRQVHDEQNTQLQRVVKQFLTPGRILFDLYGGSANLSLPLADQMSEIHCVDLSVPQGDFPKKPPHLTFYRSPVAPWLESQTQQRTATLSSAILDPPREGLAQDFSPIAAALTALGVKEIVLVGCDPDAWARDVSRFIKKGWQFQAAAVIDLFPQTHHIESVARLVL